MLNRERLIEELNRYGISLPHIFYYDETDSTNQRAKEYARSNTAKETAIFIANSQTAGRGRRGRSFVSNKGAGIYISILTYPTEKGADATAVTAMAAVALSRAIDNLCGCKTEIKWVNDIYLGNKKLAGILTEGELDQESNFAYLIIGMGINVYKSAVSDEISGIATSLEHETGKFFNRSILAAAIIKELLDQSPDCYEEYREKSLCIGRSVTVLKLNESYEARVLDVNPDFSLQLDRDSHTERLFTGEVSLKIQ